MALLVLNYTLTKDGRKRNRPKILPLHCSDNTSTSQHEMWGDHSAYKSVTFYACFRPQPYDNNENTQTLCKKVLFESIH